MLLFCFEEIFTNILCHKENKYAHLRYSYCKFFIINFYWFSFFSLEFCNLDDNGYVDEVVKLINI